MLRTQMGIEGRAAAGSTALTVDLSGRIAGGGGRDCVPERSAGAWCCTSGVLEARLRTWRHEARKYRACLVLVARLLRSSSHVLHGWIGMLHVRLVMKAAAACVWILTTRFEFLATSLTHHSVIVQRRRALLLTYVQCESLWAIRQ